MIKIASFQTSVFKTNFDQKINSIHNNLLECETQNVDIVCFPECHLTGYHLNKVMIDRVAFTLNKPRFESLLQPWARFKMTIILGLIERKEDGFYNTVAVINQGKLLGAYRKIHINEKHFQAGNSIPVFEHNDTRFGVNICNDANFPQLAANVAKQGAQILFYPLNNSLKKQTAEKWRLRSPENLKLRAQETGCWIVSSDVAGESEGRMSYGCTQIVSPNGEVVSSVPELQSGCAIFEIDSGC